MSVVRAIQDGIDPSVESAKDIRGRDSLSKAEGRERSAIIPSKDSQNKIDQHATASPPFQWLLTKLDREAH